MPTKIKTIVTYCGKDNVVCETDHDQTTNDFLSSIAMLDTKSLKHTTKVKKDGIVLISVIQYDEYDN